MIMDKKELEILVEKGLSTREIAKIEKCSQCKIKYSLEYKKKYSNFTRQIF